MADENGVDTDAAPVVVPPREAETCHAPPPAPLSMIDYLRDMSIDSVLAVSRHGVGNEQ